jgi:hypothetical protein
MLQVHYKYTSLYLANFTPTQFFFAVSFKFLNLFPQKLNIFRIFAKVLAIGIVWELSRFFAIVPRGKNGFLQKNSRFFTQNPIFICMKRIYKVI